MVASLAGCKCRVDNSACYLKLPRRGPRENCRPRDLGAVVVGRDFGGVGRVGGGKHVAFEVEAVGKRAVGDAGGHRRGAGVPGFARLLVRPVAGVGGEAAVGVTVPGPNKT